MSDAVALALDGVRARLLRLTMRVPRLRRIYLHRAHRHLAIFCVGAFFAFLGCIYFPLELLCAGPIIYGIPHLLASLRYTHVSHARVSATGLLAVLVAGLWLEPRTAAIAPIASFGLACASACAVPPAHPTATCAAEVDASALPRPPDDPNV